MSTKRKIEFIAAMLILLFISLVVIGLSVPPQPRMTITNIQINIAGPSPNCVAHYSFDLVNSGGSGFANIQFKSDGNLIGQSNFQVQANGQSHVNFSAAAPDCGTHYYTAQITSESS